MGTHHSRVYLLVREIIIQNGERFLKKVVSWCDKTGSQNLIGIRDANTLSFDGYLVDSKNSFVVCNATE